MNIKKIGLTALAASLVSVSAQAGEMTVAGGASATLKNNSGTDGGKSITMGNQLTFSGGGELDNGLNVALSFVLDHGDNVASGFDSHSLTISSDALGSLTVAGDGTGNAQSALDTTAAGDIWDNGFTYTGANTAYTAMAGSTASNNKSVNYTLPAIMDDLALAASYSGQTTALNSTTAYGITYTGVEGLTVYYGAGEDGATAGKADITSLGASYAMGSFTGAYSINDVDADTSGTDEEQTSWKLSYTVTDNLSVSYGEESHETSGQTVDEEFDSISASYTTGGMTLTAQQIDAKGLGNTSGALGEAERWKLGVSFAF